MSSCEKGRQVPTTSLNNITRDRRAHYSVLQIYVCGMVLLFFRVRLGDQYLAQYSPIASPSNQIAKT